MSLISKEDLFKEVSEQWRKILDNDRLDIILKQIEPSIDRISPEIQNIFAAFKTTSYDDLRVVIIGQDPYPTPGDAHGYAFSSLSERTPRSLQVIYNVLCNTREINTKPIYSNLINWSRRGVLLINAALTTLQRQPLAHMAIWEEYTNEVIKTISQNKKKEGNQIIFALWGTFAKQRKRVINTDSHIILEWCHPVARNNGFVSCPHFSIINSTLFSHGHAPIDWHPDGPIDHADYVLCTDGSISSIKLPRPHMAGYGVIIYEMNKIAIANGNISIPVLKETDIYGRVPERNIEGRFAYGLKDTPVTSMRAEGIAILYALWAIANKPGDVVIVTDNKVWRQILAVWVRQWIKQEGRINTQSNPDIIHALVTAIKERTDKGYKMSYRHIKSHQPQYKAPASDKIWARLVYYGNSSADKLAEKGRSLADFNICSHVYEFSPQSILPILPTV